MHLTYEGPPGGWPKVSDFYITFICAFASYIGFRVMLGALYRFVYKSMKPQKSRYLRAKKALKSLWFLNKSWYFFWVSLAGYYVLKDTPQLPWMLGGAGDF
jgi:hypothetical protein